LLYIKILYICSIPSSIFYLFIDWCSDPIFDRFSQLFCCVGGEESRLILPSFAR
jgi:hypothetical protein